MSYWLINGKYVSAFKFFLNYNNHEKIACGDENINFADVNERRSYEVTNTIHQGKYCRKQT